MIKKMKCSKCREPKPASAFSPDPKSKSGRKSQCKGCRADKQSERDRAAADKQAAADAARVGRLTSDYAALKIDDFDVTVGNVPETKAERAARGQAAAGKRQEYNRFMGKTKDAIRASAGDPEKMPAELGTYVGNLSEQEFRFGNRRLARSVSLFLAAEALALRQFKQAAGEHLRGKVVATGYARKVSSPRKRSVCLLLSDLHLGSDLSALDNPLPFRAVQEARRLEYLLRQVLDYKPQYRKDSRAVLLFNGDIIEGQLMHDLRDGAPLAEQKVIAWKYLSAFVAYVAQAYPEVLCVWQNGNHGRDKVRHPGRATSRKWDGHEFEIGWALKEMTSGLRNVTWQLDFRAVSIIDLHGSTLGLTHGDTEVKLGDPDTKALANRSNLDRINSTRLYGREFDAWAFGHYHKPRHHPGRPDVIYNGALVPPNGYARGAGYIGEVCGQYLWEAVAGYPVGDLRFVKVGEAQDRDEQLGIMIVPFRFSE